MLNAIVSFSLRFRGIVIALSCLALGYGIYTATQAKLDVFPEFAPPQVVVQTEAPGLSPEQVEQLVTLPVETALNGVAKRSGRSRFRACRSLPPCFRRELIFSERGRWSLSGSWKWQGNSPKESRPRRCRL